MNKFELTLGKLGEVGIKAIANRNLLIQTYQHIEAGNIGALAELFDEDVRFYQAASLPYGVSAHGKQETIAALGATFAAWEEVSVSVYEIATAGDIAVVHMRFSGVAARSREIYEADAVELFRFREGKIIELRPFYWDTYAASTILSG